MIYTKSKWTIKSTNFPNSLSCQYIKNYNINKSNLKLRLTEMKLNEYHSNYSYLKYYIVLIILMFDKFLLLFVLHFIISNLQKLITF